jgi:DNA-binding transcriptional MerR regulator
VLKLNEKLYKSIAEVSDELKIKEYVLRYWETQFSQLRPKRQSRKRLYTQHDIDIIKKIEYLLYERGFTIKGVQNYLNHQTNDKDDKITQILEHLKSLRKFLLKLSS